MVAPQAQTIAIDLEDRLTQLALSAGVHGNVEKLKAEILHECSKLQKVDVVRASLLKSNYYALLGDRAQSDYWLRNANANGAKDLSAPYQEANFFLMGYISDAYDCFDKAFLNRDNRLALPYIHKALSCGWFRKACWILDQLDLKGVPAEILQLAETGQRIVEHLKVTDEQICALMNEAHGLMREKGLIWLDHLPIFRMVEQDAQLRITYRVSLTPEDAASLTWQLIDRLIDKNLDSLGLVVSFQGTVVTTEELQEAVTG